MRVDYNDWLQKHEVTHAIQKCQSLVFCASTHPKTCRRHLQPSAALSFGLTVIVTDKRLITAKKLSKDFL